MDLQFIFNSQGERSGVYIPIDLWNNLKEHYKGLKKIESENYLEELENSFFQVKQMQDGKIEKQQLNDFLNEL